MSGKKVSKLNLIVFFCLGCFLSNCNSDEEKKTIQGIWYTCNSSGTYYELHINDNYIDIFIEDISKLSFNYNYTAYGDTLILYKDQYPKDTVVISINNSLIWQQNNNKIIYNDLEKDIMLPPPPNERDSLWLEKYINDVNQRAEERKCTKSQPV